jgi:hypothetical protein
MTCVGGLPAKIDGPPAAVSAPPTPATIQCVDGGVFIANMLCIVCAAFQHNIKLNARLTTSNLLTAGCGARVRHLSNAIYRGQYSPDENMKIVNQRSVCYAMCQRGAQKY